MTRSIATLALAGTLLGSCSLTSSAPTDPFDAPPTPSGTLEREASHSREGYIVDVVRFDSPDRGVVPGYLYRPATDERGRDRPAVLIQHGMPGDRSSMRRLARAYARAGVMVLSLSAPFNRADQLPYRSPRLLPAPLFLPHDSAEVVQLVREQRRAIDLLSSMPEVDPDRIGYVGWSYGGWIGALLGSVEPRLRAVVLMAPTGGFASWLASQAGNPSHLALRGFENLSPEERNRWLASIEPLEAERWIGRRRRAPLLIQAATEDRAVLPAEIDRLYRAAAPPKQLRWYTAGHGLGREAFQDQAAFLHRHLGFPLSRFQAPDSIF